jgi:hypothetical protein
MHRPPETERRKNRRFELTNLVVYKNFDIEEVTETINLSIGGMKIITEFPIENDETLDLSLKIDGDSFKTTARVIYCNKKEDETYEIGLKFEKTSERHLTLLRQYLRHAK